MFVDIENRKAALPGSGNEPIAFTRLIDIARYVVRLLDLSDWPKESYVIGDRVTLHEFVELAEAARGMCGEAFPVRGHISMLIR